MSKNITEFIGTFFLVLTIGCTIISGTPGIIPPLAIGAVLMAMIFAGGHISGAHYNPAITLAMWIRGRCDTRTAVVYVVVQVVAAIVAALTVKFLVGAGTPLEMRSVPRMLLAEFLFTFALAYVILNVATAKGTANNSF